MQDMISQINQKNEEALFQEAIDLSLTALQRKANDYALWIALANAYYGLSSYKEAEEAYLKASFLEKTDVISLSNLAGMYFEQKRFEEGLKICQQGLERKQDYVNLYLHQGNCFSSLSQYDKALLSYEKAHHLNAHDDITLFNLAYAYMMVSKKEKANETYEKLVQKEPNNTEYLFAYASFLDQAEEPFKAAQTYLKLLELEPCSSTHITFSGCLYSLLLKGQKDQARLLSNEWITLFPNNPVALHFLETLNNSKETTRASADYVGELFDAFADSFDEVLNGLAYQAPSLISKALKDLKHPSLPDILDLGVGTGLCGLALKEMKIKNASLTGVDLSEKMLEKAFLRGLYSHLVQKDILSYLPEHKASFDIILSADVLTYLGDLSTLFEGAFLALKKGGFFLFTVSTYEEDSFSYALEPSGRFMHGKDYISLNLEKCGLELLEMQSVELRRELENPVLGLLVICKKT